MLLTSSQNNSYQHYNRDNPRTTTTTPTYSRHALPVWMSNFYQNISKLWRQVLRYDVTPQSSHSLLTTLHEHHTKQLISFISFPFPSYSHPHLGVMRSISARTRRHALRVQCGWLACAHGVLQGLSVVSSTTHQRPQHQERAGALASESTYHWPSPLEDWYLNNQYNNIQFIQYMYLI